MPKCFALLFFVAPLFCFSQVKITGRVLNMTTTHPIPFASVFLSNTTSGMETDSAGYFTLTNIKPGRYDLIVSILGYETAQQSLVIADKDISLPPVDLVSTSILLKTVRIKPDNTWWRLYKDFKSEFLGPGKFAKQCKILNPDSLDLAYSDTTRQLTAKSRGFLIIENKALGYKVKYLLERFVLDHQQKTLVYKGYTIFEELKGTPAEKLIWAKNRLDSYQGSAMHFLRSAIKNRTDEQNFAVYKLVRKLNPGYHATRQDGLRSRDFQYIQHLSDTLQIRDDYFQQTNQPGIFAIVYPDCLYVVYKNKQDYGMAPVYLQLNMPNLASTIVELKQPYALFDSNGVLVDPLSLDYNGYWALYRVADQLPVDYEPPPSSKK